MAVKRLAQGAPLTPERGSAVGQLEHGAKTESKSHDKARAAQDRAGALFHGLGRFLHRQARKQAHREGAAEQPDKWMQPAPDDERDGQGDADDG